MNPTQFFPNINTIKNYPIGSVVSVTYFYNCKDHIEYGSKEYCDRTSFGTVTGYKDEGGSLSLLVSIFTNSMVYEEGTVEELSPNSSSYTINIIK